jgi:hypothetical protein
MLYMGGAGWVGWAVAHPETGEKRSFLTLYLTVAALWWLIRIFFLPYGPPCYCTVASPTHDVIRSNPFLWPNLAISEN